MLLKGGAKLLFSQVVRSGGIVLVSGDAARSGMLTAFAGLLLAIPGFVTDIIALVLLVPAIAVCSRGRGDHGAAPTAAGCRRSRTRRLARGTAPAGQRSAAQSPGPG